MTPETAPAALDDIRVLDLAGEIGQYCSKLLADLGADVIKIEPPGGDPVRHLPPFYHDEEGEQTSLYWLNLNTNKRSVTLDIASPEGRSAFEKLVATADVVVETFEPGYLEGLGLGYDGLAKIKPDIVLTSITGFGQTGPHAKYKAPDIVGVAMGGIMWLAGDPQDPPNVPPWKQGFTSASIHAAGGTLTALYHRDVTGEGQHVDVSMQESLSIAQETAMQTWDMIEALRCRNAHRGIIPADIPGIGPYECTDGWVVGFVGSPGGATWGDLLAWMIEEGKAEDLSEDAYREFCGNLNLRFLTTLTQDPSTIAQKFQMMAHINEVLKRFVKTKSKWEMYEQAQGRRLLFGIVSTPEDIAKNPQLQHRQWLTPVGHPELGATLEYPGPPYRLSGTPWAIRRRPPAVGEHQDEVLREVGSQK
ncbi:MAG TPA: CoA transferase [Dehalococcoidia bacterium]|nr:CoA transferase [Dehalococcoidia bacterium]